MGNHVAIAVSKSEALRLGLKLYRGAPCRHGHSGLWRLRPDGNGICVECRRLTTEKYRDNNREEHNSWGKRNPEKRKVSQDKYAATHPDRCRKSRLGWVKRNRPAFRKYQSGLRKRLRETDPDWRLRQNLRGRLRKALVRASAAKSGKTFDLVGCTIVELKAHLERQFTEGMGWHNYGHGADKWNLDHRTPCAAFDLTDPAQQRACFHFTNLQPMWHPENVKKGARIDGKVVAVRSRKRRPIL